MDENTLTFPDAWTRALLPRRGGRPGAPLPAPAAAARRARAVLDAAAQQIERVLADPGTDPALAADGRAWLADPGTSGPLGAAAVAVAAARWPTTSYPDGNLLRQFAVLADAWVARRGLLFACEAVLDMTTIQHQREPGPRITRAEHVNRVNEWAPLIGRVRAHLAVASDADYTRAEALLAERRVGGWTARVGSSLLMPTRTDWVDADLGSRWAELALSAGSVEQVRRAGHHLSLGLVDLPLLLTMVDGAGTAVAPVIMGLLDQQAMVDGSAKRQLCANVTARLPTDEAMRLLLDQLGRHHVRQIRPAVQEAARLYPRRAMRLLAEAATADTPAGKLAGTLLHGHVLAHRALAGEVLELLDGPARDALAAAVPPREAAAEADPAALPAVLTAPPWTLPRPPAAKTVLALTRAETADMAWRPGEQAIWARRGGEHWRARDLLRLTSLEGWEVPSHYDAAVWLPPLIARFGLAAQPVALESAREAPGEATVLLPFASTAAADLAARLLGGAPAGRPHARAWLLRHPLVAARALIPAALGRAAAPRRSAVRALLLIANGGHEAAVHTAADEYGPEARAAVTALLTDLWAPLPATMPVRPGWVDPHALPAVLLRDGSAALPGQAVGHLATMLAISAPDQWYPGLAEVRAACDPASLAGFGRGLLAAWLTEGAPPDQRWVLTAQQYLGDDETVRRLAALIQTWPREGGHARAAAGLDVLAGIGTDLALMHLFTLAERGPSAGLRERARAKVDETAERLGLTHDEFGDRLVPGLGLDADGSLVLEIGPRRFTVGFNEQLQPYVRDESGRQRRSLPAPDERYAGLKKDARGIARDQLARLERAMVEGRRWNAGDFRRYLVAHPLLWHLTRRLVWATGEEPFRVAEDRTFADVGDRLRTVADDAVVSLPHPLRLGGSLGAWAELFADYELAQPFPQLGREVFGLSEPERAATRLTRFAGAEVPVGTLLGLRRRGWRFAAESDDAYPDCLERVLGGQTVVAELADPVSIGDIAGSGPGRIAAVRIDDAGGNALPWGAVDPVAVSEVLRDLTLL